LNDYDSLVLGTGQYSPVFGRIGYCMILLLAVLWWPILIALRQQAVHPL